MPSTPSWKDTTSLTATGVKESSPLYDGGQGGVQAEVSDISQEHGKSEAAAGDRAGEREQPLPEQILKFYILSFKSDCKIKGANRSGARYKPLP